MGVSIPAKLKQYSDLGGHFESSSKTYTDDKFMIQACDQVPSRCLHYVIIHHHNAIELGIELIDGLEISKSQFSDARGIFDQCDAMILDGHEFATWHKPDTESQLITTLPVKTPISYQIQLMEKLVSYMDNYWDKYL